MMLDVFLIARFKSTPRFIGHFLGLTKITGNERNKIMKDY